MAQLDIDLTLPHWISQVVQAPENKGSRHPEKVSEPPKHVLDGITRSTWSTVCIFSRAANVRRFEEHSIRTLVLRPAGNGSRSEVASNRGVRSPLPSWRSAATLELKRPLLSRLRAACSSYLPRLTHSFLVLNMGTRSSFSS